MPELPEVETVVATLAHQIPNATIVNVSIIYDPIVQTNRYEFEHVLIGQQFKTFTRRGKYCVFGLTNGYLIVHLRMEGKFYIKHPSEVRSKHEHIIFDLYDGRQLRYHDTRKFGTMEYYPYPYDLANLHGLGIEPFDDKFNGIYLYHAFSKSGKAIKTLLMDQHVVAGIGNIYSDEILFDTKIHPLTKGKALSLEQYDKIATSTKHILKDAIALGGTTVRSYTSSLGVSGKFQMMCRVYGKENATCSCCGSHIQRIVVNGRSACFCPQCQQLGNEL